MTTFLAAAVVLFICALGMCVFMLKGKDAEFPKFDVGSNPEMRKRGIRCYKEVDAELHARKCSGEYSEACKECGLYKK